MFGWNPSPHLVLWRSHDELFDCSRQTKENPWKSQISATWKTRTTDSNNPWPSPQNGIVLGKGLVLPQNPGWKLETDLADIEAGPPGTTSLGLGTSWRSKHRQMNKSTDESQFNWDFSRNKIEATKRMDVFWSWQMDLDRVWKFDLMKSHGISGTSVATTRSAPAWQICGRVAEMKKHLRFWNTHIYIYVYIYILIFYQSVCIYIYILCLFMLTDMKYDLVDLIEGHSNNSFRFRKNKHKIDEQNKHFLDGLLQLCVNKTAPRRIARICLEQSNASICRDLWKHQDCDLSVQSFRRCVYLGSSGKWWLRNPHQINRSIIIITIITIMTIILIIIIIAMKLWLAVGLG